MNRITWNDLDTESQNLLQEKLYELTKVFFEEIKLCIH